MSVAKRSNVISVAVVAVVSVLGAAACQPESGSETATIIGKGQTACFDSAGNQKACKPKVDAATLPGNSPGATCKGREGQFVAQATGASEDYARRFLEAEIEKKLGGEKLEMEDYAVTCTTNGRAATQYTCVAKYRKGAEQKVIEEIVASSWREDEDESSAAMAEAEDLKEERRKKGNYLNVRGPDKVYQNKETQSGQYRWQFTYQVKVCR
jgi:hypothetical protein